MSLCVRGYHVYGEVWTATLGEELICIPEIGNVVDRYAVAVKKDSGETVGHLPRKNWTFATKMFQSFCCNSLG